MQAYHQGVRCVVIPLAHICEKCTIVSWFGNHYAINVNIKYSVHTIQTHNVILPDIQVNMLLQGAIWNVI